MNKIHVLRIWLIASLFLIVPAHVFAQTVTVGVIKDGDSYFDEIIPLIKEELGKHLEAPQNVAFKMADAFNAKWDKTKIRVALQAALDDPEVDYVLVLGALSTQEALDPSRNLTKPVLSSFIQMSDLFAPFYTKDGVSRTKNASFLIVPDRVVRDAQTFHEMIGFEKLSVLVSDMDKDLLDFYKTKMPEYEKKAGVKIELVVVPSDDIDGSLSKLKEGDAVYLTYMPRLTKTERQQVIQGVNRRQIPSFSMLGHSDVHLGVLAAQTPDMIQQVVRRMTLNISELVRGTSINDLPVILPVDTALLINGETASKIKYFPDLETQISATIINSDFLEDAGDNLTLQEAFHLAEKGNTSLKINDADVETAKQTKNIARSSILPQVSLGANYARIDSARAGTIATLSEELGAGTLSVSQVIFDDKTFSDFRYSIRLYEGSKENRETSRLDALENGGQAFLQYSLQKK